MFDDHRSCLWRMWPKCAKASWARCSRWVMWRINKVPVVYHDPSRCPWPELILAVGLIKFESSLFTPDAGLAVIPLAGYTVSPNSHETGCQQPLHRACGRHQRLARGRTCIQSGMYTVRADKPATRQRKAHACRQKHKSGVYMQSVGEISQQISTTVQPTPPFRHAVAGGAVPVTAFTPLAATACSHCLQPLLAATACSHCFCLIQIQMMHTGRRTNTYTCYCM